MVTALDLFDRESFTYGQLYERVLAARTPDEARETFRRYVAWLTPRVDHVLTAAQIEQAAQANIGYLFGYGGASKDQIAMWGVVTGSVHPFGFV